MVDMEGRRMRRQDLFCAAQRSPLECVQTKPTGKVPLITIPTRSTAHKPPTSYFRRRLPAAFASMHPCILASLHLLCLQVFAFGGNDGICWPASVDDGDDAHRLSVCVSWMSPCMGSLRVLAVGEIFALVSWPDPASYIEFLRWTTTDLFSQSAAAIVVARGNRLKANYDTEYPSTVTTVGDSLDDFICGLSTCSRPVSRPFTYNTYIEISTKNYLPTTKRARRGKASSNCPIHTHPVVKIEELRWMGDEPIFHLRRWSSSTSSPPSRADRWKAPPTPGSVLWPMFPPIVGSNATQWHTNACTSLQPAKRPIWAHLAGQPN